MQSRAPDNLAAGAAQLRDGTGALSTGAGSLYDGILELKNGIPALSDGVSQLRDGAMQLNDGLNELNEKGIQKLIDAVNGDVSSLAARLRCNGGCFQRIQIFLRPCGRHGRECKIHLSHREYRLKPNGCSPK